MTGLTVSILCGMWGSTQYQNTQVGLPFLGPKFPWRYLFTAASLRALQTQKFRKNAAGWLAACEAGRGKTADRPVCPTACAA